ncbi:hypothetical protein GCM10023311_26680 [Flaviramulus aquimarinus]|uniref:Glycosyl hydrolase family 16 n=1 Tax=Flaviramulus aquimarinus TaxID=1170456 RepID=A0ABP9FEH1_9FLAO
MKNIKNNYAKTIGLLSIGFMIVLSCERDISDDAVPASFPATSEVFLDGFSGGMQFDAFGDIFNFEVDNQVTYKGTASMRFAVPAEGETGSFAGGNFYTGGQNADGSSFYAGGRDLSGFDALTFWAKASQSAEIDEVGFGLNPDQGSVYRVSLKNVAVNSNWKKYYIPIPDASKLTAEQGLFYYFEGAEEGEGYTFWIDELQFEKLGTIAHGQPLILNGNDETTTGFNAVEIALTGLGASYSLPNGTSQTIGLTPAYFTFSSSDDVVASVNDLGVATINSEGSAVITASLGTFEAQGSLTIEAEGDFLFAPTPTRDPDSVISVFSDYYTNAPVDFYNGYWEPWQTTESDDFSVNGDNILNYTNFNFVGNQFANPTIDATNYSNLHFNMFIPGEIPSNLDFLVSLVSFGPDGVNGGGDDTRQRAFFKASDFEANTWSTLDIPITLGDRSNMALIIYENVNDSQLGNFYLDNIYFYDNGIEGPKAAPEDAPEAPTEDEVTNNVISIFSDAYTDVPNESLNFTPLGATLTIKNIADNNVLEYLNLNFIEQEFAPNTLDISMADTMHIDVWSPVNNDMRITLKDYGENGSTFAESSIVLEGLEQNQWKSYDIPLADFNGAPQRSHIGRIIIENGASTPDFTGTLFVDNIYFYTN